MALCYLLLARIFNMSPEGYLQAPKDQKFYRYVAVIMTFLGLGHQSWWGYGRPHIIVALMRLIVTHVAWLPATSQMVQLYLNWENLSAHLSTLSSIFAIIPVSLIVCIYVTAAQTKMYKHLMYQFMRHVHMYNFRNNNRQYDQILIKVERYIRYMSVGIITVTFITIVAWVTAPAIHNAKILHHVHNRTKQLQSIIYFYVPFDYLYDVRNWIILHTINAFMTFVASFIIDFSRILNFIVVFHWIGHINVLKYKIRAFSSNIEESRELIEIIKYHIFILSLFSDIKTAFGINVTANYCYNLVGDSLLLYNVMFGEKETSATFGLMVILYMGDLVFMSFVLEEIRRQTDDLSDLVYSMPWHHMSLSNQKTFLVFYGRVQETLEFVSAGGLRAGVRPMISIVKSAFSYYVMLKSTMKAD